MQYVVDVVVRSENDVDVLLFRQSANTLVIQNQYCANRLHAIVAYLYISALANMLGAKLDSRALASYRYIRQVYELDQRKN